MGHLLNVKALNLLGLAAGIRVTANSNVGFL